MESGKWRVESGEWKVESGKWKTMTIDYDYDQLIFGGILYFCGIGR